jgi:hypothetical protein
MDRPALSQKEADRIYLAPFGLAAAASWVSTESGSQNSLFDPNQVALTRLPRQTKVAGKAEGASGRQRAERGTLGLRSDR